MCPGVGDEGAADLAAFLGADRDVLQVRLGRREPAGRRRRQRVVRVHALGRRVDVARQRVGVGRLAASMTCRQSRIFCGSSWPCSASSSSTRAPVDHWPVLVLVPPGSPILPNRMSPSCFGLPGLKSARRRARWISASSAGGALRELAREPRQHLAVDRDAAPLHARQHRQQRPLQRLVDGASRARRPCAACSTCHSRSVTSASSAA